MTSSCSSQSVEALSDPMPRIYSCFCQKLFTTYPGIYLHLKSKHANLFQRYKRLKITKLFKKVRDQKGSQIYKLDRLSDKEVTNSYSNQKIFKESKKNTDQDCDFKESFVMERFNEHQKKNHYPYINQNSRKETQNFPFQNDFKKNFQARMENIRSFSNPFLNFPLGMQMPQFPQIFSNYPPLFPQFKISTKKLLQKFLLEIQTVDKMIMKRYLYDLMVFVDRNSDFIEDPRAKFKLFLSYCDQFDPKFVGPTLSQYVCKLKTQLRPQEFSEGQIRKKEKQIECIIAFGNWLNEMGMTKFQEKRSLPMSSLIEKNPQKEPAQLKASVLKFEKEQDLRQQLHQIQKCQQVDYKHD